MKKIIMLILAAVFILQMPVLAAENKDTKRLEYMNIQWWERFGDENLIKNLLTLYEKNYDLKNAALKVKENEQAVKMQFANELPQISLSGDLSRDLRGPYQQYGNMRIPNYSQYNYLLPITAGYEVDIWGTNRLRTKSVKQQFEIAKQAERAVYIMLTSDFAADYFNLIKADSFLAVQDEIIKTQEDIVSKTADKYNIGLCSINELLTEESTLTALKEEKNLHIKTREILINSLRAYLADSAGNISRSEGENLNLLKNLPSEYSADIVSNRPDYLQEEANIKRIGFDVKAARREFLPKFIIYGQIGLNAYHLDTLFNSASQFFNAGVLPSLDLFSGGRKIAFLKFKKLEYEEALNNYQKTILEGIKEVNSGVAEYKTASDNYNESLKRLAIQDKIYSLAQDKHDIGTASDLDVLLAKEAFLVIKKEEVSNKINAIVSTIGLYKAAGGVDLYKTAANNL